MLAPHTAFGANARKQKDVITRKNGHLPMLLWVHACALPRRILFLDQNPNNNIIIIELVNLWTKLNR